MIETFINECGSPTYICSDKSQRELRKNLLEIISKYNIYSVLLRKLRRIRTLLNGISRSTRSTQTPSLTGMVLISMCGFLNCCFGLVYPTSWLKLHTVATVLMRFPLEPTQTPGSSYTKNYGILSTIIMHMRSYPTPRINSATSFSLHTILVMLFHNVSL